MGIEEHEQDRPKTGRGKAVRARKGESAPRRPGPAGSVPETIGAYRIEREIGRGAMGVVFLARDTRLDRAVAVKSIPAALAIDGTAWARLEREAKALASINHPNVATIYGLEEVDGHRYVMMELVEGHTVAELLKAGPLPLEDALRFGRQVAAGLQAAHDRGVIHRDLTPRNVKVTPQGVAKVLDFGLARSPDDEATPAGSRTDAVTSVGVIMGTPGYMSPEQALGDSLDARTDVWAFGCMLFELLAGKPAFGGRTRSACLAATLHRPPDWSMLPEQVPARIRGLLVSCLEKDPAARLASIAEARIALEEVIAGREGPAPQTAVGTAALRLPSGMGKALTSFVGRERELDAVRKLLRTARLLTLTGAGGCGKTRLAQEVASRLLAEEDWTATPTFVELAPLSDPALVSQAVASALGVREEPGLTLVQAVASFLRLRETLLVLDNCEHLLEACGALVEELLPTCAGLRLLATSREALGVAGEQTYRVPSLSVPDEKQAGSHKALARNEAVRLFVERARLVQPAFALTPQNAAPVASICQRLDGIPLAIELAAARVKVLAIDQIAARLSDRFRLLTGGSRTALKRHQTLRAAIDWSYDLLSPEEREVLLRLCVFMGGWTIEAAEQICASDDLQAADVLDILGRLVDKSLVLVEQHHGTMRYRLLETVRQYARERLAGTPDAAAIYARHRDTFASLAEESLGELEGPEQARAIARLETEHDNLRAALEWCRQEEAAGSEAGLRLAGAMGEFWRLRGYWSEGREHLSVALAASGTSEPTAARARALSAAGMLAWLQGDYEAARPLHEESLAIRRALADDHGVATSLSNLGNIASARGDYAAAKALYEESLAKRRRLGDEHGMAASLNNLGNIAYEQGSYASARALYEEGLAIVRELRDKVRTGTLLDNLGNVAFYQGDLPAARGLYEESLALRREMGDSEGTAMSLNNLGNVAHAQGDHAAAHSLFEESLALHRQVGNRRHVAISLNNLGNVAQDRADYAKARELFERSLSIRRDLGDRQGVARALTSLGLVAIAQGDHASARVLHGGSLSMCRELGDRETMAHSLLGHAKLAASEGHADRAARLLGAALALLEAIGVRPRPPDLADNERQMAALRGVLGPERFAREWDHGRSLSADDAAAFALGESATA